MGGQEAGRAPFRGQCSQGTSGGSRGVSEFCAEMLGDSDPISPRLYKFRMESAMMRAVRFWYPPEVTMRMGTWRPRTVRNTSSSRFTMPCGETGRLLRQASLPWGQEALLPPIPRQQCGPPVLRLLGLQSSLSPAPRVRTYLWADGQAPKTVPLEDIGACVVYHHVRWVLLEGFLEVPLHFTQVLIILRAPLQLHLSPDGL